MKRVVIALAAVAFATAAAANSILLLGAGSGSSGAYSVAADPNVLAYYDALDTANVVTPQGAVSSWSPSGGGPYGAVIQATGTDQPAHTSSGNSGKVAFDGSSDNLEASADPLSLQASLAAVNLPDASNGDTGKGFTCTGLAKASDGTWWIGNDGRNKNTGGNGLQLPSLVHVSADFATKLGEILLVPLFPSIGSVQGVAIDPSDGSLWFASLNENKVRHISTAGTDLGSFTHTSANGLTWDTLRDEMIVGGSPSITAIKWYTRAGVNTQSKDLGPSSVTDPDHFWFNERDGSQGQIWLTQGANGSTGNVFIYDIASQIVLRPSNMYPVTAGGVAGDAVEGLHYDFSTRVLTVVNDAYYHSDAGTSPALNRALQYTMLPPLGTKFAIFGVFKWPAAQVASQSVVTLGNPLATANYGGIGFFNKLNVTDTVRVISQTGISGASQDIMDFSIADNRVKSFYFMEVDYVAKTVVMYINGSLVSTGNLTNSLGVGFTGRRALLAARRTDSTGAITNFSNVEISCIGVRRGLGNREAITAQLMAKHGL